MVGPNDGDCRRNGAIELTNTATDKAMSDTLSLFHLEQTLTELMAMLWEPDLSVEEHEAIESQIKEYVRQEVRKVDNIRGYLRHCELMEAAAREEIARLDHITQVWKQRRDALVKLVKGAMETFEVKRLEGTTGAFSLRTNGGKQPVVVDNPELVPDEYCVYEGAIPGKVWKDVLNLVSRDSLPGVTMKRVPRMSLIEAALQKRCVVCQAYGETRAEYQQTACTVCGGSGKQGVPGAHLEERGSHVRVE